MYVKALTIMSNISKVSVIMNVSERGKAHPPVKMQMLKWESYL